MLAHNRASKAAPVLQAVQANLPTLIKDAVFLNSHDRIPGEIQHVVGRPFRVGGKDYFATFTFHERAPGQMEFDPSMTLVHSRTKDTFKLPQDMTQEQFDKVSKALRDNARHISDDIAFQGSRISWTAQPGADLDVAIRVPKEKFDTLIEKVTLSLYTNVIKKPGKLNCILCTPTPNPDEYQPRISATEPLRNLLECRVQLA